HDCNLCGATGLKGTEFARADITGAKLPEDLKEFKSLAVVEEISKNARKIFLAMLLGCAYAWLTILTTTDARLILNSVSSPLPIIGAEIRIAYFYYAAPVILLGLYIYLHLYLQRLWEGLSKLPAIFEDGKRLDERAYPWLLNGLVRRHFDKLKGGRSGIEKTEELVSLFLAWWVVPLTFGLFWYWYLVRHHWPGTGLHIVLISLSIACAILFYRKHADSLRGSVRPAFHWKRFYRTRTFQSMSVVALCAVVSYGAIEGLYFEMEPDRWYGDTPSWARADLREAQLSTIPPSYWSMDSAIRDDAVRGANLRGADLRYAHMQGSFLVNADLKYANLEGSNLWLSNLSNANLDSANLTGVDLTDAELPGATLRFAKLSDAELDYANLSDATMMGDTLIRAVLKATNLTDADVRNSNFDSARLTDAILIRADLRHSRFVGTVFDGAYLRGTKLAATNLTRTSGLTQVQIYQACCDTLITKLPPGLTIKQCQK
ncbi:MAG: pentapeptide repeat-containing protein, partial [candidate division Zixibacteria bacterium]|nr:pentapeptide repeat-containing protein [candidate division Zixibacteria bacterium]